MGYNLISGWDDQDVDQILSGGQLDLVGAAYPYAPFGAPQNRLQALQGAAQMRQAQMQQAGQQQALQLAMAQRIAQQGAVVRSMNPTKARRQVLGMSSSGTVAAAASASITARPQTFAFKPQRVIIPATVGPDFTIQDIKVGNVSQLVQSGDLPAEAYSQTAFGVDMDMDTVQTSQDFVMQVTNISGAARTFRAMIVGKSANG